MSDLLLMDLAPDWNPRAFDAKTSPNTAVTAGASSSAAKRHAPKVRVVVLNFDGGDLTVDCLNSLLATDYPADRLELVVVDNGSVDGSPDRIAKEYPTVRLIEPLANLGFAGGCNLGIRADGAFDYVALVNNDATVTPGWLVPLVRVLEEHPKIGAVSPKMVFANRCVGVDIRVPDAAVIPPDGRELGVRLTGIRVDGVRCDDRVTFDEGIYGPESPDPSKGEEMARWTTRRGEVRVAITDRPSQSIALRLSCPRPRTAIVTLEDGDRPVAIGSVPRWVEMPVSPPFDVINNAGSNLYPRAYGGDRGFLQRDRGQFDEPAETFAWCGGAVLLRKAYLDDVGLFDEDLFLYYEDFDLSWRGRLRGWIYRYEPSSLVRHWHAASSVEWSPVFRFHTERNRILVAVKNAPAWVAVREVLAEARRLNAAAVRHLILPPLRLRLPRRHEPAHRWRIARSLVRRLPKAVAHRWSEPISVSRKSIGSWETRR